jgi:DNA-binding SARP family transcriptional activator
MPVDPGNDAHERTASSEEDGVERMLRLGQHQELFPDLIHAVGMEPFRERRWRQLMLALYRCGRQTEALRQFVQLKANMLEEIGREPSIETENLERAILLSGPELNWSGPDSIAF